MDQALSLAFMCMNSFNPHTHPVRSYCGCRLVQEEPEARRAEVTSPGRTVVSAIAALRLRGHLPTCPHRHAVQAAAACPPPLPPTFTLGCWEGHWRP